MINLMDFFLNMENYTIIKIDPNFPRFNIGKDDIDVLCLNINNVCNHIINILQLKYPDFNYKKYNINNKIHIDVLFKNKFIIKFDLCDNIVDLYPKYDIPTNLTKSVIETSIFNKYHCKIPTINNELMIRQLEYDTYINSRPDKIKHLIFIKKHSNILYKKFNKI